MDDRRRTQARHGGGVAKVAVLELVHERQYTTKGSDQYVYYVITEEDFEDLGPGIEEIQVIAELKDSTTNFRFKVKGQKSYSGQTWLDFTGGDVLPEKSVAASPIPGAPYDSPFDLRCPKIQLLVGVRNADGITTLENGVISITLIITYRT